MNQEQQNRHLRPDNSRNHRGVPALVGLNVFYFRQIFVLDSAIVKTQQLLSWHGGFLTYAMHIHRERN